MTRHTLFPKYISITHRCRVEVYKCEYTGKWKAELQYRHVYRPWFGLGKLKSIWQSANYTDETIVDLDTRGVKFAIFKLKGKRNFKLAARKQTLDFAEACEAVMITK